MGIDFSRHKFKFIVDCYGIIGDRETWYAEAKVINTSWKYVGPPAYTLQYQTQSSSREEALSLLYEQAAQPLHEEAHPSYHELQVLLLAKIESYL
jgi:hypothetical protein